MKQKFNLIPKTLIKPDGVVRISYNYRDLSDYIKKRADSLLNYILNAGKNEKKNFSSGIYINPNRKNSIWKRKISKREILKKAVNSYI